MRIVSASFIGGGNRSILRKPLPCGKSLTNFIMHVQCCIKYTSLWEGFKHTTFSGDRHWLQGSCISNDHTITTTTAPISMYKQKLA